MTTHTYPTAFLDRMQMQLGDDYGAFFAALCQPPKRSLRVNTIKTTVTDCMVEMAMPYVPNGVCQEGALTPDHFAAGKHPLHAAGLFYMQEASAQLPATLPTLPAAPVVLDLCAAPGGKSTQLAARMQGGVLIANEIVARRAAVLTGNLERMGVTNAVVTNMEPHPLCLRLQDACDVVLVDAPCAGEGMFRKDDVAVSEWSPAHVTACAVRQRAILEDAAIAVKRGGQLVYATCSFSTQENEETVAAFLDAHPDFTCVSMQRLYPHTSLGEGQFAALLQRQGKRIPSAFHAAPSDRCAPWEAFAAETAPQTGQIRALPDGRVLLLPALPFSLDGLRIVRAGLLLGEQKDARFVPSHALAMAHAASPILHREPLDEAEAKRYLMGETLLRDAAKGFCAVTYLNHALGLAKAGDGMLKNHLPKGLRLHF